jgi:hypothetical protein
VHDITRDRRVAVTVDTWRLRTLVSAPSAPAGAEMDRSMSEFSLVTDISTDGRTLLVGEFGDVEAAVGAYLRPVDGGAPLRVGAGLPLALSPDGGRVAALLPDDAKLLVVYSTANAEQPAIALGPITSITSARWIDDTQLVVVGAAAGAATPYLKITPPPLGLRSVDSFVLRADGTLYAYSYGQELSHLYVMSLGAATSAMT